MPARRYRYIGLTPVMVPDLAWGDDENPVNPGDVSEPYDGDVNSEVLVPVGSDAEKAWLAAQKGGGPPSSLAGEGGGKPSGEVKA
jgi:hypothetical protein